jgi:small-conductance mechanosensitive channel
MIQLDGRIFQHHRASTPPSLKRRVTHSGYWRAISAALALLIATMSCTQAIAQNLQPTASPAKTANPSSRVSAVGKNAVSSERPGSSTATSPVKSGSGLPLARPQTLNAEPAAATVDSATVISYLGELISWYRQVRVEDSLATEPAETLFVADDRQNANRILDLGFQYAYAAAKIIDSKAPAPIAAASANSASNAPGASTANLSNLIARRAEAQSAANAANNNVQRLKDALSRARPKRRAVIAHQLATAQAELALAQSQVDAMSALINFENGSSAGSDLQAQIVQLRTAVTGSKGGQNGTQPGTSTAEEAQSLNVPRSAATASGMVGQAEGLFALTQKSQEIDSLIELTNHMQAKSEQLLTPLRNETQNLSQRTLKLAADSTSNDLTVVQNTQTQVAKLTTEHKLVLDALLPLSMQTMAFTQYEANLKRWRSTVTQRGRAELRSLLLRLGGLLVLLITIVGGAALWRRMTFRYVHDLQRRHQLLWLSRIAVVAIISLVLLFGFANELGALATVMGFAAAGIALTLQNVILSLAGYFYISGRYGIRLGDRVQISGISGDVIEIGLFKMTLMELGGDDTGSQPTGRITVFPNSVVFQPNGNFSKQLPGSDFAWHELRLTLAPECDYRLAERRLLDIVNDVFRRYRDTLQREYRGLERNLNQPIEPPRPQSRLRLSEAGIEIVIRYPVQFKQAAQTADEISRRLVDALKREPALKLVTPGTPMIQPVEVAEADELTGASPAKAGMPSPDFTGAAIEGRSAAAAAAAAAGATVANALIETSAAAQTREGLSAPAPALRKP